MLAEAARPRPLLPGGDAQGGNGAGRASHWRSPRPAGLTEVISYLPPHTKAHPDLRSRPLTRRSRLHREASLALGLEHGHVPCRRSRAYNNLRDRHRRRWIASRRRESASSWRPLEYALEPWDRRVRRLVRPSDSLRTPRPRERPLGRGVRAARRRASRRTEATQGNVAQAFCALAGGGPLERGAEDEARRLLGLVAPPGVVPIPPIPPRSPCSSQRGTGCSRASRVTSTS